MAFPIIERFTALIHKRTTNAITIDERLREIIVKDGRRLKTSPPNSAALPEHTFRAAYIAGHVWNNPLNSSPDSPKPSELGWICT